MPTSKDPEKRATQLANLRPGAGAWKPGDRPAMRHGLFAEPSPAELAPYRARVEAGLPLRDHDGGVPAADRENVDLAARALFLVDLCTDNLLRNGGTDAHGNVRPEVDGLGRAIERLARQLDRLGLNAQARAKLGFTLASTRRVLDDHGGGVDNEHLLDADVSALFHAGLRLAAQRSADGAGQVHDVEHGPADLDEHDDDGQDVERGR